ncbi:MAG: dockerin type I repeat-containing protein [Ruminococcus sp.]|nr:dockerin type I repeat-containing protein [Ruminococcus sp.]
MITMMKKKLLSGIVASAFSMSLLTSIGTATASNQAFAVADYDASSINLTEEAIEQITIATTQPTETTATTTTAITVTISEQQAALDKLAEKENVLFGEFQRERAIIRGDLAPDSDRLTLDEVNEIIRTSDSYDEICEKLREVQPYADYYGGSGVSLVEYWFDDKGVQKIVMILEQEDIFYSQCAEDGTLKEYQVLYPVEKQVTLASYQNMMIGSFSIYNGLGSSLSTTPSEGEPIGTQTTEPTQTTTTTTTVSQPIDEQQAALDKLAEKERILFGEFQRERAVISGELSSDASRLTLDEVNKIIRTSDSYDEICEKLREVQPYADYYGGSGVSLVEYWFDDKGAQKIVLILEQEDIFYAQCTEDGFLNEYQALYSVEKQMNLENYKTKMIGSYMIYNDVDASGDINGDGKVSVSDVVMLQKWLLAVPDTNLVNWKAADFRKDNKLDVFDLTLMKEALIGN